MYTDLRKSAFGEVPVRRAALRRLRVACGISILHARWGQLTPPRGKKLRFLAKKKADVLISLARRGVIA